MPESDKSAMRSTDLKDNAHVHVLVHFKYACKKNKTSEVDRRKVGDTLYMYLLYFNAQGYWEYTSEHL